MNTRTGEKATRGVARNSSRGLRARAGLPAMRGLAIATRQENSNKRVRMRHSIEVMSSPSCCAAQNGAGAVRDLVRQRPTPEGHLMADSKMIASGMLMIRKWGSAPGKCRNYGNCRAFRVALFSESLDPPGE